MTLFEAGILAKMTTDEYKNLPEASRRSEPVTESDSRQASEIMGESNAAPTQVFSAILRRRQSLCVYNTIYL